MQKLCKNDKNIYGCCLQQEYPREVCLMKSRKLMISIDPQFNPVRSSIFNLLVTENLYNYPAIALSKLYFEQLQENNILRRRLTLDKFEYVSYILYIIIYYILLQNCATNHYVKSVRIRSFSGPYFFTLDCIRTDLSVFSPNTVKYGPEKLFTQ